jgi:mRNA-degrading endonuclease RelE of RelBE toxin-antitoxin system
VSSEEPGYALRVTGPAERQLNTLSEGTAAAIVEFMLGALLDNPQRLGGALQRELAGMRSARRGAYRIIYEIEDIERLVIVYRIEHRATAYRPR